jgi:uncharacterized membrane protein
MRQRKLHGACPRRWTVLAVVAAMTMASAAAARNGGERAFRGHYMEVDRQGYLLTCGGRDRLLVSGGPAGAELSATYAVMANTDTHQLYVEVRGLRHGRNKLTVDEIDRVQTNGSGCTEVLRNTLFKASGALPEWNLYIDPTGLRIRTLEEGGPVSFPYHKYWRHGGAWVFDSHNDKGDIHVELRRGSCVDKTSGDRYGFQASVAYGDKHFVGCAYPGLLFR